MAVKAGLKSEPSAVGVDHKNWWDRMNRQIQSAVAAIILMCVSAPGIGQEPHHSRISIVHPGFEPLQSDLKAIIGLTDAEEQKQWENIKDYIDMFQIGIDGSRPVRVDVLTGVTPTSYLIWIPLATPEDTKQNIADEFRDSLKAFGYETVRDSKDKSLYEIQNTEGAGDTGWFRVIADLKYGVFVMTTDRQDTQLLRQVILKASDPRTDVEKILSSGASVGAELINLAESADDQSRRRSASAELRKISMDIIQKRPEESTTEFDLRRHLMKSELDETERLMAEAREIRLLGTFHRDSSKASLTLHGSAISGTSLDETIRQMGVRPDAYAAIAKPDGSVMSVRLNHPIDKLRQGNVEEFLNLVKKDVDSRIDSSKELSAEEQTSTKSMLAGLMELTLDGIRTGHINALLESTVNEKNEFTVIGSVSVPQAARLNDILPLLEKSGKGNSAEMNVGKIGEMPVHRIQLAEGYVSLIDRVFGTHRDLFVVVDADRVWMAAGPGALEAMTAMIGKMGPPAVSPTVLRAELHLLPWIKRLDDMAKEAPEKATKEEKELQRSRARNRARALAAMKTEDLVILEIKSTDGIVTGELSFDVGAMRFAGKMMSAFAKENMSE